MLNALMGLGNRVINTSSTSISGLPAARRLQEEVNNHERLGDLDKAKECFEAGIRKAEDLLRRTHNKSELGKTRERLAASHFYYGNFLRECGDKLNAEANYKKALEHAGYMDLEQPEAVELFNQISVQYRSILADDGNASQGNISQLDQTKVSEEHGRISKLSLIPLRRQGASFAQEKSALVDYLFEKALSTLGSLEVSNKPSLFLVYAHDNSTHGKAEASTSRYLIKKLSKIRVKLYSDQTPMGQPYSSSPEDLKEDGKLEDILTNQLCLLPDRLQSGVKPVDKVVVCCSEVLGSYLKWPDYDNFYKQLREAYREDRETYLKDGEQAKAWAIREVVREFSQEPRYKAGFHHVLTEMAFLQIRAEWLKNGHGIIPVPLTRGGYDDCLPGFISATTVRMGDIPRFEAQVQAGREVYPNQSRHWVLFKLIERLLVDSDEAKTFLNKFWQGYDDCISWLKSEPSTPSELEFVKLVDRIFDEIERALHKQLASTVKQVYPAWQKVDARLLDQSRDLAKIQTRVNSLVKKLLGNLQKNIQKLRATYLEGLQQDREIKDALANYVSLEGIPLHDSTRFDLESKVRDFLNSDKKVLLLLGEAGSGKSTFNRHLAVSLWEAYTQVDRVEDVPIPVFIELSSLSGPSQNLLNAFFETQGFSKEQINELQTKHRFVLILDGFDEIEHRQQVFYKDNQLHAWQEAKIIISSRPEYLGPNYQYKFHPSGERSALQEYQLAPFSEETIKRYIDRYSATHRHALWNAQRYRKALEEPNLKELVSNPFLLKITLSVLPELSGAPQTEGQRFTRITIYDQFVKSWFDRSQQRLNQILVPDSNERKEFKVLERAGFAGFGVDFSKELAVEMYQAGEVITYYLATTYAKWKKNNALTELDWQRRLLSDEDTAAVLMRLNAPLICQDRPNDLGKAYRFIHKSLRDYFVARALWEELSIHVKISPSSWFNKLTIVNDPAVLQFLVERVWQEPELESQLLSVIEQSKGKEGTQFEKGAANALTILVKAGIYLNGKDFSGIRVRGANLSNGVFDHTRFEGADLRDVDLSRAWLRLADFAEADLAGLQLGEKPALEMKSGVMACCYSPDDHWLAVAMDEEIRLYETGVLQCIHTYDGHEDDVESIAFSSDGQWLASGSSDCTVKLWHVWGDQSLVHTYDGHESRVTSVAFSSDGQWLASGSSDCTVKLWFVSGERTPAHTYDEHEYGVMSIAFSSDGQWLASGSYDWTVKLWTVTGERTLVHTYYGHEEAVMSVAFSRDGQWLASGSNDGTVKLWTVTGERTLVHTYDGHEREVMSVAFSSDSKWLVSGSTDWTMKLWFVTGERTLAHTYAGHDDEVMSVVFSSDSQWLVSGSLDKTVRLWTISGARTLAHTYDGHEGGVGDIAFSSDGQWLASGNSNWTVKLRTITGGKTLVHTYNGHESYVPSVAFSSDGQWLASGSGDQTVKLWDASGERTLVHTYKGHEGGVLSVAFSSDGQWLASGSRDQKIKLWSVLGERTLVHTYSGHEDAVMSVAFSPDGQWLASGSNDKTVRLWTVWGVRTLKYTYDGHKNYVRSVAFSSDGKWLASGSIDWTVKLWTVTGERTLTRTYDGHEDGVTSVAFSSDGQWLASASMDKTVRLWSTLTGDCQAVLKNFVGTVKTVAWQPTQDGPTILGTADKAIRLWRVTYDSDQIGSIMLDWASRQNTLNAEGAWIENAKNLDHQNKALLMQLGAGHAGTDKGKAANVSTQENSDLNKTEIARIKRALFVDLERKNDIFDGLIEE
ncbi:NACHT domain-containing protein [Mycoavidus sp. SF9855]|uniref:NACHT domain-containing protein n=1 Tax=Mycoavidus sp. SF9855 TaxID=2968475 RepID=UPI00211C850C|nr:NACHT domain-containing protein [Mycoavidus sp. SF9855]UUM21912.1 NACHT domain-containing protein [Mycoavidus sp. SF9855]